MTEKRVRCMNIEKGDWLMMFTFQMKARPIRTMEFLANRSRTRRGSRLGRFRFHADSADIGFGRRSIGVDGVFADMY